MNTGRKHRMFGLFLSDEEMRVVPWFIQVIDARTCGRYHLAVILVGAAIIVGTGLGPSLEIKFYLGSMILLLFLYGFLIAWVLQIGLLVDTLRHKDVRYFLLILFFGVFVWDSYIKKRLLTRLTARLTSSLGTRTLP